MAGAPAVKVGPIVKWAGGKTKLLPALLAHVPARFGRYFEPFAGGAALFFALRPARAVLGDINAELVTTYEAIKRDPEPVIRALQRHARVDSAAHYYRTRDGWNLQRGTWSPAALAAAFIYMNKSGFNGIYRVNRQGLFNVPYGRNSKTGICVPAALRAAHVALHTTVLRAGDYRNTLADVERGDFVYIDSPHAPRSRTSSFTAYAAGAFGDDAQRELADVARQLVARGAHVVLSNADTTFVRALYKGFAVQQVKCPRAINSDASKRGDVDELIIVGSSLPQFAAGGTRRCVPRL